MAYCYHCMTKLDSPDMPFCPECGRKHNSHHAESFELPAGTKLSKNRYLVGRCTGADDCTLTYIGCDLKMERKVVVREVYYKNIFSRNTDNNNLNVKYDDKISLDSIMKQISRECIGLSETDSLTNTAKVYDWFSENNTAYIVCEFVSNTSLAMRADELGGYEWENFYDILKPLLESLSALHEKNLYHKNIKPQNIKIRKKLDGTEELVLTDFGIVCPKAENGLEFSSTPYEPPEQRNRTGSEGEHTDIYSAAASIYYALTAAEPVDIITKNTDEIFPLLKPYRKSKRIPENVYYALKYALQPDPNNRCKSIDTFITRLETVQKPVTVKSGSTLPKIEPPSAPLSQPTITAAPTVENTPPAERVLNIVDDNAAAAPPKDNNYVQQYSAYAGNPNAMPQTAAVQGVSDGKGSRKGIIAALSAAVCILLAGVIILTVMLISKSQDKDSRPEKSTSSREVSSEKAEKKAASSTEPTTSENSDDTHDVFDSEAYDFAQTTAQMGLLMNDVIDAYKSGDTKTLWNGKTAEYVTAEDICKEYEIDDSEGYYTKEIGGSKYYMVWTNTNELLAWGDDEFGFAEYDDYTVIFSPESDESGHYETHKQFFRFQSGEYETYGILLDKDSIVCSLEDKIAEISENSGDGTQDYPQLPELEEEAAILNMLTKEAVNTYLAEIYTTHWNGQTADQATVHDVCYENDIDDSENYYSRTIDGVTYTFVWVYDDGQGNVRISGGAYNYSGIPLDGSNYIRELAEAYMEERNKSTDINVETDYADEQSEEPQEEQL